MCVNTVLLFQKSISRSSVFNQIHWIKASVSKIKDAPANLIMWCMFSWTCSHGSKVGSLLTERCTHVVWRHLYWRAAPDPCFSPSCAAPPQSCVAPSRRPAPGRTVCHKLLAAWMSAPPLSPWRAAGWTAPAAPGRPAAWMSAPAAGWAETCLSGRPESGGRGRRAGTLSWRQCPGSAAWEPPALNNKPPL